MVVVGLTLIVAPVPIEAPLAHPPEYHFQNAFVPNEPPVTLISVFCPGQIVGDNAEAPVGPEEGVFTATVTDAHEVVPQSPSALTKYVVVTVGFTFIVPPVPIEAPFAQPPIYHFHDAPVPNEPPVTLILVFPPVQIAD